MAGTKTTNTGDRYRQRSASADSHHNNLLKRFRHVYAGKGGLFKLDPHHSLLSVPPLLRMRAQHRGSPRIMRSMSLPKSTAFVPMNTTSVTEVNDEVNSTGNVPVSPDVGNQGGHREGANVDLGEAAEEVSDGLPVTVASSRSNQYGLCNGAHSSTPADGMSSHLHNLFIHPGSYLPNNNEDRELWSKQSPPSSAALHSQSEQFAVPHSSVQSNINPLLFKIESSPIDETHCAPLSLEDTRLKSHYNEGASTSTGARYQPELTNFASLCAEEFQDPTLISSVSDNKRRPLPPAVTQPSQRVAASREIRVNQRGISDVNVDWVDSALESSMPPSVTTGDLKQQGSSHSKDPKINFDKTFFLDTSGPVNTGKENLSLEDEYDMTRDRDDVTRDRDGVTRDRDGVTVFSQKYQARDKYATRRAAGIKSKEVTGLNDDQSQTTSSPNRSPKLSSSTQGLVGGVESVSAVPVTSVPVSPTAPSQNDKVSRSRKGSRWRAQRAQQAFSPLSREALCAINETHDGRKLPPNQADSTYCGNLIGGSANNSGNFIRRPKKSPVNNDAPENYPLKTQAVLEPINFQDELPANNKHSDMSACSQKGHRSRDQNTKPIKVKIPFSKAPLPHETNKKSITSRQRGTLLDVTSGKHSHTIPVNESTSGARNHLTDEADLKIKLSGDKLRLPGVSKTDHPVATPQGRDLPFVKDLRGIPKRRYVAQFGSKNTTVKSLAEMRRENTFQITPIGYDSRYETPRLDLNIENETPEDVREKAREKCNLWLTKYTR